MLKAARSMHKNYLVVKSLAFYLIFLAFFFAGSASAEVYFGAIESNQNEIHLALPAPRRIEKTFKLDHLNPEILNSWKEKWDTVPPLVVMVGALGSLFYDFWTRPEKGQSEDLANTSRYFSLAMGSLGGAHDLNLRGKRSVQQAKTLFGASVGGAIIFSHALNYRDDISYSLTDSLVVPALISCAAFGVAHYGIPRVKQMGLSVEQGMRDAYGDTKDRIFNWSSFAKKLKDNARLTCQGNGYQDVDYTRVPLGRGFLRYIFENKIVKKRILYPIAFQEGDIYFLGTRLESRDEYTRRVKSDRVEYYTWSGLPCMGDLEKVQQTQTRKDRESLQAIQSKKDSIFASYRDLAVRLASVDGQNDIEPISLYGQIAETIYSNTDGKVNRDISTLLLQKRPSELRQILVDLYTSKRFDIARNLLLELRDRQKLNLSETTEQGLPSDEIYQTFSKIFFLDCPCCLEKSGTATLNHPNHIAGTPVDDIVVSNCGHSICNQCIGPFERSRCEVCYKEFLDSETVLVPLEEFTE